MIGPCDECRELGQKLTPYQVRWLCMSCYLDANRWSPEKIKETDVLSAPSDNNAIRSEPKKHRFRG